MSCPRMYSSGAPEGSGPFLCLRALPVPPGDGDWCERTQVRSREREKCQCVPLSHRSPASGCETAELPFVQCATERDGAREDGILRWILFFLMCSTWIWNAPEGASMATLFFIFRISIFIPTLLWRMWCKYLDVNEQFSLYLCSDGNVSRRIIRLVRYSRYRWWCVLHLNCYVSATVRIRCWGPHFQPVSPF